MRSKGSPEPASEANGLGVRALCMHGHCKASEYRYDKGFNHRVNFYHYFSFLSQRVSQRDVIRSGVTFPSKDFFDTRAFATYSSSMISHTSR